MSELPHPITNNQAEPAAGPITEAEPLASREAWLSKVAMRPKVGGTIAESSPTDPLTIRLIEHEYPDYASAAAVSLLYEQLDKNEVPQAAEAIDRIEAVQAEHSTVVHDPAAAEAYEKELQTAIMSEPHVQKLVDQRDLAEEHRELERLWPTFIETYEHGLRRGIDLGYIPSVADQRFKQAIQKTGVRVADEAVIEAMMPAMKAYYNGAKDEVSVSHAAINDQTGLIGHLTHEFTHQISGGTFTGVESDQDLDRRRVGYHVTVGHDQSQRAGFNEFLTQHVTMGILTGDFETLDPDKRADKDKTYYQLRKVGAAFIEKAKGVIDPKVVIQGQFEDTGPEGSSNARRQMLAQFRQAYGKGVLRKMDQLYELADLMAQFNWKDPAAKIEELVTSCIHSPVLNEQGEVVERGEIDTTDLPDFTKLLQLRRDDRRDAALEVAAS